MTLPPGITATAPNQVCKLNKSLYGLKQAGRQWNLKLTQAIKSIGYKQSAADPSLFTKQRSSLFSAILVYVDDVILVGNDTHSITITKQHLDKLFSIKDLGSLHYFLGFEFSRNSKGLHMCQRKYILELLQDLDFLTCKPASSPALPNHKPSPNASPLSNITSYRQLIGKLLYITHTRPELSYIVNTLSQHLNQPTTDDLARAHRILRYLKGTIGLGLFFPAENNLQLQAFSDSDWASCPESRRSITGYIVFLGNAIISWRSKKQSTVSRSSSEAEYRALASTSCELHWLTNLLKDITCTPLTSAMLFCDNISALHIAHNPVFHERTKHIDIDCHVVRERVKWGLLRLMPIPSSLQLADLFTKAQHSPHLRFLLSKLGLLNLYQVKFEGE
ncbi:uncharacterized mitochondrial protein AtMg00810-like [Euphorbia lathyris]|uniref:uncharacterized mitochondrial protein AtMg00810-like n=1 Tax=Euphorbia lathyris TaxID=212925 RepID=UPI0033138826